MYSRYIPARAALCNKGLLKPTAVESEVAEEEKANFRVSGERKNSNNSASLPFSLSEGKMSEIKTNFPTVVKGMIIF